MTARRWVIERYRTQLLKAAVMARLVALAAAETASRIYKEVSK